MEISVVLLERNVFAFGETLRSQISFRNTSLDKAENLGWASAQIHCSCTLSDVSSLDEASLSANRVITSFQPVLDSGSRDVYASNPSILFADMTLEPGASKDFFYEEKIPQSSRVLPPSYMGQRIKYSYKLIVGTQRVNSGVKMVKIPFRVIQSLGGGFYRGGDSRERMENEGGKVIASKSSPFLVTGTNEEGGKQSCVDEIPAELFYESPKTFHHYEIANKTGKLAKLSLFKNSFRIGEEVMGSFEFYNQEIRCVEFSVSLMSEENLGLEDSNKGKNLTCVAKCHDVTLGYQFCNLALQIPLHVTPTFETDTCLLHWYLHFVFVIAPKIPFQESVTQKVDDEWNGPQHLEVETMVWDLPITLCPTSTDVLTNSLLQPFSKRSVICQI